MSKFIFCFSFLISISNCQELQNTEQSKALYAHWVHSYEDEDGTGKVYRLSSYDFPISRGRHGFQLQENGRCIEYAIAAGDGSEKRIANWTFEAKDIIKITYPDGNRTALRFRIISLKDEMLTVELLSN